METIPDAPIDLTDAQQLIESLASEPQCADHPFVVEDLTYAQLYAAKEAIKGQLKPNDGDAPPICLATDHRGRVTAALLAALCGGPPLVMPYAFDKATLAAARQSIPFTHALTDEPGELPPGVKPLSWSQPPDAAQEWLSTACISQDKTWLYLFTGGSTGAPQVWSKTPRNLLMEVAYLSKTFKVTSGDKILATVPANHIYGLLYAILLPLVSGASVSVATPSFPNEIIHHLETTQATILVSIPAHYRALKKTPIPRHRVRAAFSSAGALAEEDSLEFYKTTGIGVTEIYGSTETGGIARRNRAMGQTALHPFECLEVQIADEHLGVRSPFLSPELIKNDQGFFETADRAAWQEPGGFVILGRSDGIVKVGGKRVDLAKTREILMQVSGVRDAYVFAVPVQSGRENEIVALVEGKAEEDRLYEAARQQLPPYARPRNIKVTEQMPLSSTGKYNRTAIQEMFNILTPPG